jgi:Helicase associated domain
MSAERRKRLDAIGFVWDWREYLWENGIVALAKFKAREGHCRVPALHIEEKFKLGQWVTGQRSKKDKMPAKGRRRLNKIGFVWRAFPRQNT